MLREIGNAMGSSRKSIQKTIDQGLEKVRQYQKRWIALSKSIHHPLNSMASSLDQERIEFESHAGQMSLEQLNESLKANEKLIQLFELQKGAIPQVLEMMQTVLKQELEKKQSLN